MRFTAKAWIVECVLGRSVVSLPAEKVAESNRAKGPAVYLALQAGLGKRLGPCPANTHFFPAPQ